VIQSLESLQSRAVDALELLEILRTESAEDIQKELDAEVEVIEAEVAGLEFRRMFSGKMDAANAYLEVQSGSGGTEAQDWAEMLLRMYLRWGDQHGFKTTLMEASPGDVAGIKSATIYFEGEYAFGWLPTRTTGTISIDAKIRWIDFHLDIVINLRGYKHSSKRRMAPIPRIKRGLTDQSVHTCLSAQPPKGILTFEIDRSAFNPCHITWRRFHQGCLKTVLITPT
jgi:hypothetical protein